MTPFTHVEMAPRDPILGLNEAYGSDTREHKVNLGVGVYYDADGHVPLLRAVRAAEEARLGHLTPRGYLPIDGIAAYNGAVQRLLFGSESQLVAERRVVTAQGLGGTGALTVGADFLKHLNPGVPVAISNPSWENHRALFEAAGFQVVNYPYYDAASHGLDFAGMLSSLSGLPRGAVVVLHACCHNPTGVDLDTAQWRQVVDVVRGNGLLPFLDIAYQGFGDGIEEDAGAVRLFADAGVPMLVASSFSKSFSLYGERVGALSIVAASHEEALRVQSQVKRVVRSNYSNPPTHGASVVSAVLYSDELRAMWHEELGQMRGRIRTMRLGLVERLKAAGVQADFDFIVRQRGMFSYSGLSSAQVDRLREEFAIYAVGTGRICVAALNDRNIDAVARAIAAVS